MRINAFGVREKRNVLADKIGTADAHELDTIEGSHKEESGNPAFVVKPYPGYPAQHLRFLVMARRPMLFACPSNIVDGLFHLVLEDRFLFLDIGFCNRLAFLSEKIILTENDKTTQQDQRKADH